MASEEVLIVGVEDSSDLVYLGKKATKGKEAAHPTRKRRSKKSTGSSKASEGCLVILDCGSGSEDGDYVEMTGGGSGGEKRGKDSTNDLESVVGSPPKKLHISSSHHSDTELSIVDVTSTKPAEEKLRLHEDSVTITEDQNKVPPSAAAASSSKYNSDVECDRASSKSTNDPPSSSTTPSSQTLIDTHRERVPTCWTNCPNCPPDMQRTYHLIDVAYNSAEWSVVSSPLTQLGFVVNRVQRIQNETLWQRLCYEKKLMLRDRHDVNEQLLYHTSRSPISIICEEGLDHRLSVNGNFGRGIYFSDSPFKCNSYWRGGGASASRYMFCCRVLLGEIKKFPKGKCEQLQREPPKPNPRPGETKFYDSVMGNLTGLNEFVVYNAYRVMPEYVICYSHLPQAVLPPHSVPTGATVMATTLHLSLSMPTPLPRTVYRLASPRKKRKRKKQSL